MQQRDDEVCPDSNSAHEQQPSSTSDNDLASESTSQVELQEADPDVRLATEEEIDETVREMLQNFEEEMLIEFQDSVMHEFDEIPEDDY